MASSMAFQFLLVLSSPNRYMGLLGVRIPTGDAATSSGRYLFRLRSGFLSILFCHLGLY